MIIILSYIFYFIAASVSPLQRRWLAVNKNGGNTGQINFTFQVMLIITILSVFLPLFEPMHFAGNPFKLVILSLICGVFGAITFVFSYTAQRHIEAGVTSIIGNVYTPVAIILSTLFLSEGLNTTQILGTVLLLAGVVVVSKKHRIGRFKFDKYFIMMLLSGVFLGFVVVAERALQKTTGFSAGTMLSWWSQCLFLGIAVLITKSRNVYSNKDILITGTLRFFQALSWVTLIFVVGNLSLVSSITTFKVVIVFIAAAFFLKEREDVPRKILGSVVALVGLLLMK
ncbi:MAG: EamA family transporter [Candidatus Pacebacteria bacterium]|nr:EamA family transporter [Candidatus Paceibacterota bacterium]